MTIISCGLFSSIGSAAGAAGSSGRSFMQTSYVPTRLDSCSEGNRKTERVKPGHNELDARVKAGHFTEQEEEAGTSGPLKAPVEWSEAATKDVLRHVMYPIGCGLGLWITGVYGRVEPGRFAGKARTLPGKSWTLPGRTWTVDGSSHSLSHCRTIGI